MAETARRRVGRVLAFAALAVGSAGCAVSVQDSPQLVRDASVPFGLLEPDAPTLVPPATARVTEVVLLCFVDDDRLRPIQQSLDVPVSLADVVAALAEPPTEGEIPLRTLTSPPVVNDVRLSGGVVQVDLRPEVSALGGNNQLLAVAQLVCTLTSRPGVGQVSFTLAGAPVDVPRGDGSLTASPVSRDDYAVLLP